ncbi:hypothetical protein ACFQFC_08895 [Amorphoplanes digitatis]|uniref:Uncharacterized protein n=1 Tax=Actinoplanes digitatis TaxID=1868 RepID=A0A7W7I126_9ACTN|nr:hypothetical protein [Actinoplanes digitatis]MBB4764326.1 hypothetical protein [Actinoplanes digitatis]GID94188.1 hypothetical protein Adi01nite_36000 [Actinoplanes digitatis]
MLLRVPDAIQRPLWEGELEPDDTVPPAETLRGTESARVGAAPRNLPVVSIGRPEVWNVVDFFDAGALPTPMRAKLSEASFYLVRLACSFRPAHDSTEIDWARFSVSLQRDEAGLIPSAFDLHPLFVTQEVKRNVTVSLAPTLKFLEVEAGIGAVGFGFEYQEIQPVISASGAGESEPAWDFQAVKGTHVYGSKWMHLLVRASPAMTTCHARLELSADVVRSGLRIAAFSRPRQTSADPLTVRLWG